jgi:hypothetical protein
MVAALLGSATFAAAGLDSPQFEDDDSSESSPDCEALCNGDFDENI